MRRPSTNWSCDEVERPARVWQLASTRIGVRVPIARLRPPAPANGQPFLAIEPKDAIWFTLRPSRPAAEMNSRR